MSERTGLSSLELETLYPREWEVVLRNGLGVPLTSRLRVPGGWMVMHALGRPDLGYDLCMAFLPDPNHEWVLEPEGGDQ